MNIKYTFLLQENIVTLRTIYFAHVSFESIWSVKKIEQVHYIFEGDKNFLKNIE